MKIKRYKDFIKESKEEKDLWIYNGDFRVDESMILNGKFIKEKIPDIINGYFNCADLELTTLEGGPKEVGGSFDCSYNDLTSLIGGPEKVEYGFLCHHNLLTSLEGGPKEVRGSFDCRSNKLTSLLGVPEKIGGDFECLDNLLTSLEYGPKEVGVNIYSDFKIEGYFIKTGSCISNYWEDLLVYMIKEKIDLQEVKGWPNGFLTDEIVKSVEGLKKFNL